MTLRPDTIRERLSLVRSNLAALRETATLPRERFLADRKEQWATAYALQVTVQALLDAGAHVLSGHFSEGLREYGDVVPRLLQHGVLEPQLAERLRGLSGFRNLLVHEYGTVDYGLVHEKLGRLDELAGFAAAIEEWLTTQGF
jgi:uncharacterized protein YutE (UPF0331/DUF86 family)